MPFVLILFLRIALPQSAGHTSFANAELRDGVFSGTVTYNAADWLAAVAAWYKADITKSPKSNVEVYERNYFRNFFRVWADQVQIPLDSLGRSEEADMVKYSFKFNVGNAKEFVIDHRAIFDLYPDQTHTMTFRMFGKDKTYTFKSTHPTYFAKK